MFARHNPRFASHPRKSRSDGPKQPGPTPPVQHYFARQPGPVRPVREFSPVLRGRRFHFVTAAGVFSASRLDPGTALLIESLEVKESDTVLDLGCGWGAIGIVAAALAPQGKAWLVDPNPRAVAIARHNAALNGLTNVELAEGEGTGPVRGLFFDVVATNPPIRAGKAVVFDLIEQAAARTRAGGRFYIVARTKQGAKGIAQKVKQVFGNVTEVRKGGGYRVYSACALRAQEGKEGKESD